MEYERNSLIDIRQMVVSQVWRVQGNLASTIGADTVVDENGRLGERDTDEPGGLEAIWAAETRDFLFGPGGLLPKGRRNDRSAKSQQQQVHGSKNGTDALNGFHDCDRRITGEEANS